jgi:hypothetical protein
MPYTDYVIKNCSAHGATSSCPKRWSALTPAFSDMVRHCVHCNKKVYLCETDEQIKFYSSVKFCIAVPSPEARLNEEGNTPSSIPSITTGEEPANHNNDGNSSIDRAAPNVWRRPPLADQGKETQRNERSTPLESLQKAEDSDIPAFLRKQKK